MHNPVEVTAGFCLKSCYHRPSTKFFMNIMQQPGPDLPYGTVPGASRSNGKTFFGFHPYIWQKDVAKISKVAKALHYVNPARVITGLVSVTIILLYHFSIFIHLDLASFYASKYF